MKHARHRKPLEETVQRVGQRRQPFRDLYAFLLHTRWPVVVALAGAFYLALNTLFALLYWAVPGSIANSDRGFADAFFFSVQSFATIGFGFMYSQGTYANVVVVIEAFVSLLSLALLTGIVFAKFARPRARVLFSNSLLIETRDGLPTLTFRVANERGNDVVEATIRVSALISTRTREGAELRRFFDLPLERDSSPVFLLSWQVFHPITEDSPLFGMTLEEMAEKDVRFAVSFTGLDGTFAQTVHARHMYWVGDLRVGHRFVDVIEHPGAGIIRIDFRKFHQTEPQDPKIVRAARARSDA